MIIKFFLKKIRKIFSDTKPAYVVASYVSDGRVRSVVYYTTRKNVEAKMDAALDATMPVRDTPWAYVEEHWNRAIAIHRAKHPRRNVLIRALRSYGTPDTL